MKKKLVALMVVICLALAGCASSKKIEGKWYDSKGIATLDDKDPCVHYDFVVGNLIWSLLLLDTIIAPIYFFGWSIYEPTREKYDGCIKKARLRTSPEAN